MSIVLSSFGCATTMSIELYVASPTDCMCIVQSAYMQMHFDNAYWLKCRLKCSSPFWSVVCAAMHSTAFTFEVFELRKCDFARIAREYIRFLCQSALMVLTWKIPTHAILNGRSHARVCKCILIIYRKSKFENGCFFQLTHILYYSIRNFRCSVIWSMKKWALEILIFFAKFYRILVCFWSIFSNDYRHTLHHSQIHKHFYDTF